MRKKAKLIPVRRCTNCSEAFVPLYQEIKTSCSPSPLKVKDVISSVYRLHYLETLTHKNQDDDAGSEITEAVCSNCADNLGELYRTWVTFNQLRSLGSDLTTKLKMMDDLLDSITQQSSSMDTEKEHNVSFVDPMIEEVAETQVDQIEMKHDPHDDKSNLSQVNLSYDGNPKNVFNFEVDQDEEDDDNDEYIIPTDPLNFNFANNSSQDLDSSQPMVYQTKNNDNCHQATATSNKKKKKGRGVPKIEPVQNNDISCDVCQKAFPSKKEFQIHEATHKNKDPVVCSFCDESFIELFMLYSHHRIHGLPMPFNCPYCSSSFATKPELVDHIKDKILKFPRKKFDVHLCAVCGRSFKSNFDLVRHTADHCTKYDRCLASRRFTCALCKKISKSEDAWIKHLKTHGDFTCPICEKSFSGKAYFLDHERKRLDNLARAQQEDPSGFTTSLTCRVPGCSAQFCFRTRLMKHEDEDHPDKSFACQNCKRRFSVEFYLKSHQKICLGTGQSKCPLLPNCEEKDVIFETPTELREHLLASHVDVVEDDGAVGKCRIGCPLCTKTYMSMANLNIHIMGHTGEWKRHHVPAFNAAGEGQGERQGEGPRSCKGRRKLIHECGMCPKRFRTLIQLRSHMKNHRDDGLTVKCPKCDRTFLNDNGVLIHDRVVHLGMGKQKRKLGQPPEPTNTGSSSKEDNDDDDGQIGQTVVIKQEDCSNYEEEG